MTAVAATTVTDYATRLRAIADMRSKELFFVTGLPRSGSTWLTILLNAHPRVSCAGEGHFLSSLAPQLSHAVTSYNAYIGHKNKDVLQGVITFPQLDAPDFMFLLTSTILLLMASSVKARRVRVVGEKTPGDLIGLPFLNQIFPTAKFIHILRDPRDCAVSTWFHNIRMHPEGACVVPATIHGQGNSSKQVQLKIPTLDAFVPHYAQMWLKTITRWEQFAATAPDCCMMVRYEDLVTQSEAELTRVFKFLGVSTTPTVFGKCIDAGTFTRLSGGRPPGVEDRGSLLRQGLPGDWRNHLGQGDELTCRAIAGGAMTRYGYVD